MKENEMGEFNATIRQSHAANRNKKLALAVASVAFCLGSQSALAIDAAGVEFNGYFRAGAAQNNNSGTVSCFALAGALAKYRLGNECDNYGEFTLSKDAWQSADGAKFKANLMTAYVSPQGDNGGGSFAALQQMYVEGRDVPELQGAKIWLGKRFYKRHILYITDFGYNNPSGTGLGIEDLPVAGGAAKFSYAFFRQSDTSALPNNNVGASRHDLQLTEIGIGKGATLDVGVSLISKDSKSAAGQFNNGTNVFAEYKQKLGDSVTNTLYVAHGTGTGVAGSYGSVGAPTQGSGVKRTGVLDYLDFTLGRNLSGQALAAVYSTDDPVAGNQKWYSAGGRLVYAFTDHFRLNGEIGYDKVKPTGQDSRTLTKFTIAPALALDRGFWSRPELRLYYTYAKWNDAARNAAAPGDALSATGVFGSATSGSNFGVQLEAWF